MGFTVVQGNVFSQAVEIIGQASNKAVKGMVFTCSQLNVDMPLHVLGEQQYLIKIPGEITASWNPGNYLFSLSLCLDVVDPCTCTTTTERLTLVNGDILKVVGAANPSGLCLNNKVSSTNSKKGCGCG